MFVHETLECDAWARDEEDVTIVLTGDEAGRLMALLNQHETSGSRAPGSTLFTALHNAGVREDPDARRQAERGRPVAVVSEQWPNYWDTPEGEEHKRGFYAHERIF